LIDWLNAAGSSGTVFQPQIAGIGWRTCCALLLLERRMVPDEFNVAPYDTAPILCG